MHLETDINAQKANSANASYNPVFGITKGVAIILIALGHNIYFSQLNYYLLHTFLYQFHVWIFFLLLTVYPVKALTAARVKDIIARTMVPNLYFIVFASLLYYSVINKVTFVDFLPTFMEALIFQSPEALKEATGFHVYWFLPSFCVFSILWLAWKEAKSALRLTAAVILVAAHGLLGMIPADLAPWIPLGVGPALYVLPLAVLAEPLASLATRRSVRSFLGFGTFFLVVATTSFSLELDVNLAMLQLYGFDNFGLMLLQDAIAVGGFLTLLSLARIIRRNRLLEIAGKYSLYIFLVHQIVFQLVWRLFPTNPSSDGMLKIVLYGVASLCLSLGCGLLFGVAIQNFSLLRMAVFPRSLRDCTMVYSVVHSRLARV